MRKRSASATDSDYTDDESEYSSPEIFSPHRDTESKWDQKEWNQFVEMTLEWLNAENPTDPKIFCRDRMIIPAQFNGTLCYVFKGKFLPSGNKDGLYWRPSQGATPTGNRMLKRYFYSRTKGGNRIKRQLSCLEGCEDWWFVDYRVGHQGATFAEDIKTCSTTEFNLIITKVCEFKKKFKQSAITKIEAERDNFVRRTKLLMNTPMALNATSENFICKKRIIEENGRTVIYTIPVRKSSRSNPTIFKDDENWQEIPPSPERSLRESSDSVNSIASSASESNGDSPTTCPVGSAKTEFDEVVAFQLSDIHPLEQFYNDWGYLLDSNSIPFFAEPTFLKEKIPIAM